MQEFARANTRRHASGSSRRVLGVQRDSARRCAYADEDNQVSNINQRLKEEAISADAYRKLRHESASWFNRGQGSAEKLYETFIEAYGVSRDTDLLFFSFAGVLSSRHEHLCRTH
jgi:hypothetical protein